MITEEQLSEAYRALNLVFNKHQNNFVGSFEDKSKFGAQFQWLVIVRLLAELCQHGTEKEVVEITDALRSTLIQVVFKK